MTPPDISLVVPVRDEAGSIGPLAAEIQDQLDKAGLSWELVLVDDGSTDGSWEEITATAAGDGRIQGIRHDRGRGKSAALMTGFARCSGRAVAMLDGDGFLSLPDEWVHAFDSSILVVMGRQTDRDRLGECVKWLLASNIRPIGTIYNERLCPAPSWRLRQFSAWVKGPLRERFFGKRSGGGR